MFKKLTTSITALTFTAALAFSLAPVPVALAECANAKDCVTQGAGSASGSGATTVDAGTIIRNIVNLLLFVIGAVSVVMIVIGGLKYTTSNGDASAVKSAKDTIMYSVVGVVIALLAYAIVNFVISSIKLG